MALPTVRSSCRVGPLTWPAPVRTSRAGVGGGGGGAASSCGGGGPASLGSTWTLPQEQASTRATRRANARRLTPLTSTSLGVRVLLGSQLLAPGPPLLH